MIAFENSFDSPSKRAVLLFKGVDSFGEGADFYSKTVFDSRVPSACEKNSLGLRTAH
jgi:hypothetical protein